MPRKNTKTPEEIFKESLRAKFAEALEKTWQHFEGTLAVADKIGISLRGFAELTQEVAETDIREKLSAEQDKSKTANQRYFQFSSSLDEAKKTASLKLEFHTLAGKQDPEKEDELIFQQVYAHNPPCLVAILDSTNRRVSFEQRNRSTQSYNQDGFTDEAFNERTMNCFDKTVFPWAIDQLKFEEAKTYMRILKQSASEAPAPVK